MSKVNEEEGRVERRNRKETRDRKTNGECSAWSKFSRTATNDPCPIDRLRDDYVITAMILRQEVDATRRDVTSKIPRE